MVFNLFIDSCLSEAKSPVFPNEAVEGAVCTFGHRRTLFIAVFALYKPLIRLVITAVSTFLPIAIDCS